MPRMRLLHAADLHLDSPLRSIALRDAVLGERLRDASRMALRRIVDLAIEHEVDALVLAGDVFDDGAPDMVARTALVGELSRLASAGIPVVLIRGNHDALLDHARHGPLGETVHLLDAERPSVRIGDATFHGLSFTRRHAAESQLPRYPEPEPERINVGLMHTSLGGAVGHDPYAPCAESDLLGHGYDYWALGHIHRRSEMRRDRALAVMPGIPQGRHAREPGRGGATLVTIDGEGPRAEAMPVAALSFEVLEIELPGDEDQVARLERIRRTLAEAVCAEHDVALRITLNGAGALPLAAESGLARAVCCQAASVLEGVHVERVAVAAAAPCAEAGVLDDLAALMAEEAQKLGFRDEAAEALASWRAALPPAIRDALDPSELDALIEEGLTAVGARLLGARQG